MDEGTRLLQRNYQEFSMKNSGIGRSPDMPRRHSRREFLALAGMLPLVPVLGMGEAGTVQPAHAADGEILMRKGWILRRDDLRRLAIA
jgi:hypothetical protein